MTRAGFLGSGRFGSGVMVARLDDGSWSPPSAIGTLGGGFGGLVGIELTDFVFILNDKHAVRTFSQLGSLMIGGNMSLAAGPVGRNAELVGGASMGGMAAMFTYSKTKGLFGGISIEGGMLIERTSTNRKFYKQEVSAAQILSGSVQAPQEAEVLMQVLALAVFHPRTPFKALPAPPSHPEESPVQAQDQTPELHADPAPQPGPAELPAESPALSAQRPVELDGTPCTRAIPISYEQHTQDSVEPRRDVPAQA